MKNAGHIPLIYVITDTSLQDRFSHVELAKLAIQGGADFIQLREKKMATGELLQLALALRELCKNGPVPFIVNDRVDIALMSDADGVHLGQDDLPLSEARKILGPEKIIGGTAGTLEQAIQLEKDGADYVAFGHLFKTSSKIKLDFPKGVDALKEVCQKVRCPVVAIGGIDASNLHEVLEARPYAAAVISAVACAKNPLVATQTLKQIK